MTDPATAFASIGLTRHYSGLDLDGLTFDVHGWGHEHHIFDDLIRNVRPETVIEVGTWYGASVLRMHALTRELGLETQFICVDTWLGSNEALWFAKDESRERLRIRGNYPSIFPQFVCNIIAGGAEADVFPLPMTSTAGARVLKRLGVSADLIYIDAGHEEEEVAADLRLYYDLLRPGGVIFGAEYHSSWPGVIRTVDRFRPRRELIDGEWWTINKPLRHRRWISRSQRIDAV